MIPTCAPYTSRWISPKRSVEYNLVKLSTWKINCIQHNGVQTFSGDCLSRMKNKSRRLFGWDTFAKTEICLERSGEAKRIGLNAEITCFCLHHNNTNVGCYCQNLWNVIVFTSWHREKSSMRLLTRREFSGQSPAVFSCSIISGNCPELSACLEAASQTQ